jgi:hypothetical protein
MNEASDKIRKKKLVVGVRQQQRRRKFAAVHMLGMIFSLSIS